MDDRHFPPVNRKYSSGDRHENNNGGLGDDGLELYNLKKWLLRVRLDKHFRNRVCLNENEEVQILCLGLVPY